MLSFWRLALLLCLAGLALTAPVHVRADDEEDPDAIPQVGRPTGIPFSEASGDFTIETRIDRESVQVEEPIVFVVRIMARGAFRKPPRRLPLAELPRFQEGFYIEDLPAPASLPAGQWELRYQLKPKSTAVTEVPSVPLAFFNPRFLSARQQFPVAWADPIPIKVQPRPVFVTPIQAPEEAFQLATGPEVLARRTARRPWSLPGPLVLVLLFAAPPLVCLGWYLVWRRLYPDTARLARVRRSRAAQLALALLRKAPAGPRQRAQVAGGAVARAISGCGWICPSRSRPRARRWSI